MATRLTGASRVAPHLFEGIDEGIDIEGINGIIADVDDVGCLTKTDALFRWPRGVEQTRPPFSPTLRSVVAVVKRWTPTDLPGGSYTHLCNVYSAIDFDFDAFLDIAVDAHLGSSNVMLHLPGPLGVIEGPVAVPVAVPVEVPSLPSTDAVDHEKNPENVEAGAPSSTLLVEAVDQLRAWLNMKQQDVARYVGVSPSTVMSWKREAPQFPRHQSIPALLALWSAVAAARAELGNGATTQLIWAHGVNAGAPAVPAPELIETLLAAAAEASNAAWFEDDGYVPGQSVMPSAEELLEGEAALAEGLAAHPHTPPTSDPAERADRGREPRAPLA